MIEFTEEIKKICDEIDRKGNTKEEKKRLINNLHKAVDKMKDKFVNEINKKGFFQIPIEDLVSSGEAMGLYLSYEIKINKIRRFLDRLRRIEVSKEYDPQSVILLRPQLAYAVGRSDREEKEFMKRFQEFLDPVLKAMSESNEKGLFDKGLKLMETIIAYHRYYGGEN